MTGTAVMASISVLENHFLGVNIDGLSSFRSFRPAQAWAQTWGARYPIFWNDVKAFAARHLLPETRGCDDGAKPYLVFKK
jgi:hypothetical protein